MSRESLQALTNSASSRGWRAEGGRGSSSGTTSWCDSPVLWLVEPEGCGGRDERALAGLARCIQGLPAHRRPAYLTENDRDLAVVSRLSPQEAGTADHTKNRDGLTLDAFLGRGATLTPPGHFECLLTVLTELYDLRRSQQRGKIVSLYTCPSHHI